MSVAHAEFKIAQALRAGRTPKQTFGLPALSATRYALRLSNPVVKVGADQCEREPYVADRETEQTRKA